MRVAIVDTVHLDGPNIWTLAPVTCLTIDVGSAPEMLVRGSGTYERIGSTLQRLHPGSGDAPAWQIPSDDANVAAIIGRLAISLQQLAGVPVEFSAATPIRDGAQWWVAIEQAHERVAAAAATLAVRFLNHLLFESGSASGLEREFATRFRSLVESSGLSAEAQPLIAAARLRGIPVSPSPRGRFTDLGNGVYRRRLQGTSTSQTSQIAVTLSRDKHATKEALRAAGIPVPDGVVVTSADLAVKAAESIGFPVVVKPVTSGDSAGVSLDLIDAPAVISAYEVAAPNGSSPRVIVERYIAGNDYRAFLVNDRIIGVKERIHARVTGDGEHTIEELIDIANADPRRAPGSRENLVPITVDSTTLALLARNGHSLASVPSHGQVVRLKPNTRRMDGGTIVDWTDEVHPANADLLRWTARIVGLDIAGIDFVATDITQSIWETSGSVIEVNDHPAIGTFLNPTYGQSRYPGPAIIDMLFPPGSPVRVPIVAVTGAGDRTSLVHQIATIMTAAGYAVGLAAADGLFINGTHLRGVEPGAGAARKILNNPAVELAVIEVDPLDILEHGLCFDYCDVAVVLTTSDQAPSGFPPLETVLCRTVDADGTVVLDAGDPCLAALTAGVRGKVMLVDGLEGFYTDANIEQWLEKVVPAFRQRHVYGR